MAKSEQAQPLYPINPKLKIILALDYPDATEIMLPFADEVELVDTIKRAATKRQPETTLYIGGYKASIGCSYKGRIWSYKVAYAIEEWLDWCHAVGAKLLDDTISVEQILKHVIVPKPTLQRPALVPLAIEWSEFFLHRNEDVIHLDVAGDIVPFFDVGMELVEHQADGPIRFRVFTETKSAEYEVKFRNGGVDYLPTGLDAVQILAPRKSLSLSEWFQEEPPIIYFENNALLIYNLLAEHPQGDRVPFDKERIEAWDWSGVDLKKESQTPAKYADSIQRRVIERLLDRKHDPDYDLVFDDDDANEAADIVAIKVAGERLIIHLFHCKYSSGDEPGGRVEDLYAVCGQAQRSIAWKDRDRIKRLLDHLRHREESRLDRHNVSRFERGDFSKLEEIARQAPYLDLEFRIFIVQPGLSKGRARTGQLDLLAGTELYLQETHSIPLSVIASP